MAPCPSQASHENAKKIHTQAPRANAERAFIVAHQFNSASITWPRFVCRSMGLAGDYASISGMPVTLRVNGQRTFRRPANPEQLGPKPCLLPQFLRFASAGEQGHQHLSVAAWIVSKMVSSDKFRICVTLRVWSSGFYGRHVELAGGKHLAGTNPDMCENHLQLNYFVCRAISDLRHCFDPCSHVPNFTRSGYLPSSTLPQATVRRAFPGRTRKEAPAAVKFIF